MDDSLQVELEICNIQTPKIVIKCKEIDDNIQTLVEIITQKSTKIVATSKRGETILLSPTEILYFEIVDGYVFANSQTEYFRTTQSLTYFECKLKNFGFVRCSKSMLVNLHLIKNLKSMLNSKIVATLNNGEKILITRHYQAIIRNIIK